MSKPHVLVYVEVEIISIHFQAVNIVIVFPSLGLRNVPLHGSDD